MLINSADLHWSFTWSNVGCVATGIRILLAAHPQVTDVLEFGTLKPLIKAG